MIRFEKLSVPEVIYPYQDAVAAADYINGTFGTVANGVFTAGVTTGVVRLCIMQVEKGDDAKSDAFKVLKGEHVRVADLTHTLVQGLIVNITADELPATYEVGDVLITSTDGLLIVDATENDNKTGLKVIEVTDYGVRAVIDSNNGIGGIGDHEVG